MFKHGKSDKIAFLRHLGKITAMGQRLEACNGKQILHGNDNQDVLYVVGELLKEFQALVPKEACEKSV